MTVLAQALLDEPLPRELEGTPPAVLADAARAIEADLHADGVAFGGDAFRVDPVPRVVEAAAWERLERGLAQRVEALNAFIADCYGDREIVRAGVVPGALIESADHFEPWMLGVGVRGGHAPVAGIDLVCGQDGEFRVLEDNLRTPSGFTYAVAARAAVDAHLPVAPPEARRAAGGAVEALAKVLRAAAPERFGSPVVALLSDGDANTAWYEHTWLARALDIPIVTPDRLRVRRGRLLARLGGGEERALDVVYRRSDEDRLRAPGGRPTWLAALLLDPIRSGSLGVVNPPGSGVADDKLAHAYVEKIVRFYTGEEAVVRSVPTYDVNDLDVRLEVLARIEEMVVKPRSGHGGRGVIVCPHASPEDRARAARLVRQRPDRVVVQDTVMLSRHPTVIDGRLEPRHVDLRVYVVGGRLLPLALTRVAFEEGALVVNSSQDGGAKDTWVLG
jgi:uncharacterized circularly permuted ATP-grasp superfamily protein